MRIARPRRNVGSAPIEWRPVNTMPMQAAAVKQSLGFGRAGSAVKMSIALRGSRAAGARSRRRSSRP
jgi:hypothetical protein